MLGGGIALSVRAVALPCCFPSILGLPYPLARLWFGVARLRSFAIFLKVGHLVFDMMYAATTRILEPTRGESCATSNREGRTMTLQEWAATYRYRVGQLGNVRIVPCHAGRAGYAGLWHLTDYLVTTVSGGSVYLHRR